MSINRDFFYDEKNYCFNVYEKGISFEELYKMAKEDELKTKKQKDIPLNLNIMNLQNNDEDNIKKGGEENMEYIYEDQYFFFTNPHFIEFIFPDKTKKAIFITSIEQLIFLLKRYKNYDKFFYKKDSIAPIKNGFPEDNIPYVKIEIKIKIPDNKNYRLANKKVDISQIYFEDLSLSYKEYFENFEYIDTEKPYFEFSTDRKNFFEYLINELKQNNFIGLCGPEGIGKTASILAFCKTINLSYFYFNIKAIIKNFDLPSKILEIISNEFAHCIGEKDISDYIDRINKNMSTFKNPLDILIYIIENFKKFVPRLIVIDQYKTKYDNNYVKLKEIYLLQKKYLYKVIFISSINEEDVKSSIISCLKKEESFIKYIYISKLIEVTEDDRKKLNPTETLLLDGFGNYYFIYYLILKEKKIFQNLSFTEESFEVYFIDKMSEYYKNGLEKYFNATDENSVLDKIRFLFLETGKNIKLETFLNYSSNIPFRFFIFRYIKNNKIDINQQINNNNNNINFFKLSEVDEKNDICLEYQSNFVVNCLFNYYKKFINKKKDLLTTNFEKNLDSIKLEDSISLFLWATRNKSPINQLKIYDYVTIDSIFEPKEKDINILKIKVEEIKKKKIDDLGLLIHNFNQNAIYFDTCIIKLNSKKIFEIYFFQTTLRKDSDERFTLMLLNENLSYIKSFYELNLKITIDKIYYYYIFDDNYPDFQTIKKCSDYYIDYLKFNMKTFLFSSKSNFHLNQYIPKLTIFSVPNNSMSKEDSILTINKLSIKDLPEENRKPKLEESCEFLKRKRNLISEKKKPDEYLKILKKHQKYYKLVTGNDKYEMTYDEKDPTYNEYLIKLDEKEYSNLPGITYKINISAIKGFITKYLSPLNYENIFDIIGLNKEKYEILSIKLLKKFYPMFHFPKKGNYLFMVYNSKDIYYFDYIKKKKILLTNGKKMEETDFDGTYQNLSKYYIISIIPKQIINK